MTTTDDILAAALRLPPQDRTKLAEQLLDSVEPLDQADIDAAWVVEVRRRMKEVEGGAVRLIPADEVFRAIDERFKS